MGGCAGALRKRFHGFLDRIVGAPRACLGVHRYGTSRRGRARGAAWRASATLATAHGRSGHALLVLAHVRVARSRLERAASDLKRAQRAIAGFPDPGRLPAIAAAVEQDLTTARANAGNRDIVEEPSAAELAVLRCLAPVSPDARSARGCTSR